MFSDSSFPGGTFGCMILPSLDNDASLFSSNWAAFSSCFFISSTTSFISLIFAVPLFPAFFKELISKETTFLFCFSCSAFCSSLFHFLSKERTSSTVFGSRFRFCSFCFTRSVFSRTKAISNIARGIVSSYIKLTTIRLIKNELK